MINETNIMSPAAEKKIICHVFVTWNKRYTHAAIARLREISLYPNNMNNS